MRNLLFLSICALTTTVFSANYYVSNAGNDSNNGGSPSTAWKTLANVNSRTFQPGDSILFKRGDEWNGERLSITASGTSGNPITYSAYGTGEKPVFNGIGEVAGWTTAGNWTDMGNNVWRTSTWESIHGRVWINGVERECSRYETEGAGITEQYPWQKINGRLYAYSTSNPATAFSSLKIMNGSTFFSASLKNYITIQNFDIRGWVGAQTLGCSYWIWEYCDFSYNFNDLMIKRSDSTPTTNGIVRYCNFDSKYPFLTIRLKPVDTSKKWTYIGHNIALDFNGGGSHHWDVHHNTFIKSGYCAIACWNHKLDGNLTMGMKIHHNDYNGAGINYGRFLNTSAKRVQSSESYPFEVYNNRIYHGGTSQFGAAWLKFYNNVCIGRPELQPEYGDKSVTSAVSPFNFGDEGPYEMKIYNNVFAYYQYAGSYWYITTYEANRKHENMRWVNNIFYNNGNLGSFRRAQLVIDDWLEAGMLINPQVDNNIFWSDSTSNVIRALSTHMTAAQFNALDGNNIANINPKGNIQADPLFVDPQNGDFRLQANSPAIGAGLAPISATDAAGNAWNNPPSIGPYEYSASTRVSESILSQSSPAFKLSTTRGAIVIEPGQSRTATIEVALYDGRGRRMSLLHGAGGESLRLDTNAFAPGVYTMQILIDGKSYTRRIAVGGQRQLKM